MKSELVLVMKSLHLHPIIKQDGVVINRSGVCPNS